MSGRIDDQTKTVVDAIVAAPAFAELRNKVKRDSAFDDAWTTICNDKQLDRARQKLSMHEIRRIIWHSAQMFLLHLDNAIEHCGRATVRAERLEDENEKLRNTLTGVMAQVENDYSSAHAEICKLQGLEAAQYNWPEWSPQANTLRWFEELREEHGIPSPTAKPASQTEEEIKF